jgi:transcriptional regulator with XRE-family HTH domain
MLPWRLLALREEVELTQEELANKLHISRSGYARYETGDRKPGIDVLEIIADFYGTSIDYLVGRTDIRNPYPKRRFKRPKY